MMGSLYYSTFGDPLANLLAGNLMPYGKGLLPCELCWFARILMYPIAIMAAVALLKDDEKVADYVLPLSILGMCLEFYHFGLQKFNFPSAFGCTLANPCNALQVQYFGFVTIPMLGLVAFSVITALCLMLKRSGPQQQLKDVS